MSTPARREDDGTMNPDQRPEAELSAADAAALDALVEAGFSVDGIPGTMGVRAGRAYALLSLLDTSVRPSAMDAEALADVTAARVRRARASAADESVAAWTPDDRLSEDDQAALESLVAHHFDVDRVPIEHRARAARVVRLLGVLDEHEAAFTREERSRLTQSTMEHVERSISLEEHRLRVAEAFEAESGAATTGSRFRLREVVSIAAAMLLAGSVLFPMFSQMRERARQAACQANLASAAGAFGLYGGENRDALPQASRAMAGLSWWEVGRDPERSNSANLFVLPRGKYISIEALACSGNPNAARCVTAVGDRDWGCIDDVSYSYQNLFARQRPLWSGSVRAVILTDRSPVIIRAIRRQWIDPDSNSMNHAGTGQYALFNDGSTVWLTRPVLASGDNIWLPREIENAIRMMRSGQMTGALRGTESPADMSDAQLVP